MRANCFEITPKLQSKVLLGNYHLLTVKCTDLLNEVLPSITKKGFFVFFCFFFSCKRQTKANGGPWEWQWAAGTNRFIARSVSLGKTKDTAPTPRRGCRETFCIVWQLSTWQCEERRSDFSSWSCVHFTHPYRSLVLYHNVLNPFCKCCRRPLHTCALHPRSFSITHRTPLKLWKR